MKKLLMSFILVVSMNQSWAERDTSIDIGIDLDDQAKTNADCREAGRKMGCRSSWADSRGVCHHIDCSNPPADLPD